MRFFKWFSDNQIKVNVRKCYLLVNKKDEVIIWKLKDSEYEKLLGIKFDTKLTSNEHLNNVISKPRHKVNALSLSKKKILVNSFFNSQFTYLPVIWMLHSRIIDNKIIRLNEKCLCLLCRVKSSSFKKPLEQNKSVMIHTKSLH